MGSALHTCRSTTGYWPGNDFVFLPMPWLGRCVDAKVDETAAHARANSEDHLLVSVVVQWPVRRAQRSDVVPAYNRNALRLLPMRNAIFEEWLGTAAAAQLQFLDR